MHHIPLLAAFLLISLSASAQMSDTEKECVRQQNLAEKDYYNKEMKYYTFGLIDNDAGDTMKQHVLKHYYHIELRHMGCVMDEGSICYNKRVEQIIKRRYKTDLWQAVRQTTDSLNKTKRPR